MGRWTRATATLAILTAAAGCGDRHETLVVPAFERAPAAPRALEGWYHDRAVYLSWELAPDWDGEAFRVYGRRTSDRDWFHIAEVTSCAAGMCTYTDVNVLAETSYRYFVVAVDPETAEESAESGRVEVYVPAPVPPRRPSETEAVALDGAVYLHWDPGPREAQDFSHYRVYLADPAGGSDFLLGETDSEGFLDERARNGASHTYRVSAVDDQGHESGTGPSATAHPRPDYHGEWLWAYGDRPADSGFRFRADEETDPLVHGDDPGRHFRLEADQYGWWLVPGPSARVNLDAWTTTALKCGPGADASCVDVRVAPTTGYTTDALELLPRTTYVLEVVGEDGATRYGAVRVDLVATDQDGDAIAVFDWAYQLRPGSRQLAPPAPSPRVRP